jgi:hypothetical protein
MIARRRLLPLLLLALGTFTARAADVVYPTGSQIGLVPPPGMEMSTTFFGFQDRANEAGIVLVVFPPQAYAELEKTINSEALQKQGMTFETREPMAVPSAKAFLVIGRQEVDKVKLRKWMLVASFPTLTALVTVQIPDAARTHYPDDVVRATLQTLAMRSSIPAAEQLGLLPFKVGDISGFSITGVIPGRALMLGDLKPDAPTASSETQMLIAAIPGGPTHAADRDQFAREVLASVSILRSTRVTGSEPLRMGGLPGYQIFANAKDPKSGAELTVVQWLRFGTGGFLQFVGVAHTDTWQEAYPRFRSVRDGIETR